MFICVPFFEGLIEGRHVQLLVNVNVCVCVFMFVVVLYERHMFVSNSNLIDPLLL